MLIRDTTAVVTGAASGLGRATAESLTRRGARVFGIDLPSALDGAAFPDGITPIAADITRPEEVRAAVAAASANPTYPLRIAVSCAGIAPSARILGRRGTHDIDVFLRTVQVNLVGTFTVLAFATEAMAATEPDEDGQRGVIVNTASVAAFEGQIGQAAYAASKGGVAALTLPAARDLANVGVRVCTIAPGVVDTPMVRSFSPDVQEGLAAAVPFPRRLARPAEFARLAVDIVENDYLNGEVIRLDGALRMGAR